MLMQLVLLCVCCDIPAVRKLCGFVGHSTVHFCSKAFQSGVLEEKLDYSGYDMESWKVRTDSDHRPHAEVYLRARTKPEQKQIVQEHGFAIQFYSRCHILISPVCMLSTLRTTFYLVQQNMNQWQSACHRTMPVSCNNFTVNCILKNGAILWHLYTMNLRASLADQIYTSQMSRSDKASIVLAKWTVTSNSEDCKWHVGIIQYFIKHMLSFYNNTGGNHMSLHVWSG
jgi:hypothetical protein